MNAISNHKPHSERPEATQTSEEGKRTSTPAPVTPPDSRHPNVPTINGKKFIVPVIALGALVAGLLAWRAFQHERLAEATEKLAISTVTVTQSKPGPTDQKIVLPANLVPYSETSIYARSNGYLKAWHKELGATVKEGDLLAEIDAPDIDAQLLQVKAALAQAVANQVNAKLVLDRDQRLATTGATSRQELDQAVANSDAMNAAVKAAEANVKNMSVQQGFQKLTAPFDGVVTKRNTDVGALIRPGTGDELFHLARTDILRVYLNVPQAYSSMVKKDTPAFLTLQDFPGQQFEGKIVNVSGALDAKTRTLLTEVQVPNPDSKLLPGAFAEVHLSLPIGHQPMIVPVNTLIFRSSGTQLAIVDDKDVVHLKSVKIGQDFGTSVEITEGLAPTDRIVVNPSDSLTSETRVRVEAAKEPEKH